jgi:hypothetical protein
MELERQSLKKYFSYIPTKMHSGKWIWRRHYIRATAKELVTLGELALGCKSEYRRFTESEWILELLKQ